jgi:hypothetical protein
MIDMKFVLLHEAKNDDGIKGFFYDVWELYMKVCVHANLDTYLPFRIPMCDLDDDESVSHCAHADQEHGVRHTSSSECKKVPISYDTELHMSDDKIHSFYERLELQ